MSCYFLLHFFAEIYKKSNRNPPEKYRKNRTGRINCQIVGKVQKIVQVRERSMGKSENVEMAVVEVREG